MPVKQEISSAGTSLNQIPALFKDKNVQFGETNVFWAIFSFLCLSYFIMSRSHINLAMRLADVPIAPPKYVSSNITACQNTV